MEHKPNTNPPSFSDVCKGYAKRTQISIRLIRSVQDRDALIEQSPNCSDIVSVNNIYMGSTDFHLLHICTIHKIIYGFNS